MSTLCHSCVYNGCKNSRKSNPEKHFFKFPTDPDRQQLWIENIDNNKLLLLSPTKLKSKLVCEDHFEAASFSNLNKERLNKKAIPISMKNASRKISRKQIISYGPSSSKRYKLNLVKMENVSKENLNIKEENYYLSIDVEQPETVFIKTETSYLTNTDLEECEIDTSMIKTELDNKTEPLVDPLISEEVKFETPVTVELYKSIVKPEFLNPSAEELSNSAIAYAMQKYEEGDEKSVIEEGHISKQHKISFQSSKINTCYVCSSIFEKMKDLDFHIFTVHPGVKPYTCGVCGESFSYKYHRDNHMQTHSEEDNYEMCYEPVICFQPVIEEESVHTGEVKEAQSLTSVEKNSQSTQEHDQSGSEDQMSVECRSTERYICNVCGVALTTPGNLNIHMRIHTGVKPYTCVVCEETFNRKDDFDHHISTQPCKTGLLYKGPQVEETILGPNFFI